MGNCFRTVVSKHSGQYGYPGGDGFFPLDVFDYAEFLFEIKLHTPVSRITKGLFFLSRKNKTYSINSL